MKWCLSVLLCFYFICNSTAQDPLFPGLEGEELQEALRQAFKTNTVLHYGMARDTLFRVVYGRNDSLSGIYTDHTLYMDPALDPTQAVYQNGLPNGINTEHIWPRSMGAGEGLPFSDMHHLAPTRVAVNQARANLPFEEIPDLQTLTWYYKSFSMSSIPQQNISSYSELTDQSLEPPEHFKGDIARTMMYFFTMYEQQANEAFFEANLEAICTWHYVDPADSAEMRRTELIALYQEGKINPFIADCTLAERLYCPQASGKCVNSSEISPDENQLFLTFSGKMLLLKGGVLKDPEIIIYDTGGRKMSTSYSFPMILEGFSAGVYLISVKGNLKGKEINIREKIVIP